MATTGWTSTHSTAEFAAVRSVGFDPVGLVMGTTVQQLGYRGWGGCGQYGVGYGSGSRVAGTGRSSKSYYVGYAPLVSAMYAARRRAVQRLVTECRQAGGDGIVGTHLTMRPFPGISDAVEFQAIGTAVRGNGSRHLRDPFVTDLTGQDFAKLLMSGWMPCGLVFGVAIGVRHDDSRTQRATLSWRNAEVPGYTQLVQETRAQVRREIEEDVVRHGGEGLVVRGMRLRIREQECPNGNARDHVAEATLVGTAVTRFTVHPSPEARPLLMLHLTDSTTSPLAPASIHQVRA